MHSENSQQVCVLSVRWTIMDVAIEMFDIHRDKAAIGHGIHGTFFKVIVV